MYLLRRVQRKLPTKNIDVYFNVQTAMSLTCDEFKWNCQQSFSATIKSCLIIKFNLQTNLWEFLKSWQFWLLLDSGWHILLQMKPYVLVCCNFNFVSNYITTKWWNNTFHRKYYLNKKCKRSIVWWLDN